MTFLATIALRDGGPKLNYYHLSERNKKELANGVREPSNFTSEIKLMLSHYSACVNSMCYTRIMKIAMWNMCNKADQSLATDQIKDYFEDGYSAVALQEVPYVKSEGKAAVPLSAVLAAQMGLAHTFIHTRGLPSGRANCLSGYGTAVLSTDSLGSATHTTLRTDRWAYMTSGKGNQRAAIAFSHSSNPDVRMVISHLSYSLIGGIGAAGLKSERIRLANFLDEQRTKGAVVFGGDMNCEPGTALDDALANIGLLPITPEGLQIEHPTYQSRYTGLKNVRAPLDRIYTDSALHSIVTLGEYGPSDHRPLQLEL